MIKHKRLCALITATLILVQIMSLPSFGTEPEVKASFDGSETVIAVLSGGFAGTDDGRFSAAGISGPLTGPIPGLEGRGIYGNARFPYVYDYAGGDTDIAAPDSTGTTLCGIIVSIVPAAQLVLMKVYDDGGAVDSEAVCAAMSDAFLLGVSVILLDIDEYAGTDDGSELEGDIAALIAEADGRGIPVVCSAGNNGRAGAYGIYQSYYGITHIPADKPDYGTVSAPSSVSSVLSVGSRESKTYSVPCISFGQNGKTAFSDTNADYGIAGPYTFTTFFNDMTFEYVPVGGTGTPEDCAAAGELNGKIALIRRGELTFVEKVNNAAGGGAAGVIIYDNIENNDAGVLMALEGAAIPAVFISYESGMAMLAETDRHVYIKEGETSRFPNPDGGRMSAFSSRGVTPSLEIKPELTAEGGSRDIILFDGALKESTGSDSLYAAAEITARIAALSGYLKSRGMDYNSEALKLALMNAASPIKDESGVEFSPRAQGAGAVENLMSVLNAGARLYDARGRGKLSLGEGLKTSFAVTFYAENISDNAMTYELSATMTGDDYTYFKVGDIGLAYESDEPESGFPAFIKENARPFKDASVTLSDVRRGTGNLNVYSDAYEPAVIKLGAGEVREITLLCVLDRKTADEYAAVFPNGWFIDGYITLTSGNGNVSSIPYTGFCGSFSRLDAIDPSIYDPGSYYQSTGFYSEITENGRKSEIRLGYDGKQLSYDSKLIAFSPNDDGYADKLLFEFCLLRNVSHVSFTVSDVSDNSDKEAPLFTRHVSGGLKKSHAGSFSAGKYTAEIWNGRAADNYYYVYPDGEYRMTLSVAESGGTRQTYSLPFVVDTAAPRLASFEFGIGEDGGRNLTVELSDNHYISRVRLYTAGYDTEVYMSDAAPDMPISDYTCSFDITGIDAGFLYLEATDYASNTATYRINIIDVS